MIIAFAGKLKTGKTTLATELCKILNVPHYHSFGDIIREGASNEYQFDVNLAKSRQGKESILPSGISVRRALQLYAKNKRDENPNFIIDKVKRKFEIGSSEVFIIDDLRMLEEHKWVRSVQGSLIVRMIPNRYWEPSPVSNDITETELDNINDWDMRLCLDPLPNGNYVSLSPHAKAVAYAFQAKILNL